MKSARLTAYLCAVTCVFAAYVGAWGDAPTTGSATTRPTTQPSTGPQSGFIEEKYENGQLKSHYAVDAKGTKSGSYTLYSEEGKRIEQGTYKNGELDGTRQTYYENGTVRLRENYRKGRLDGAVSEHDEKGKIVRTAQFKAGIALADRVAVEGVLVYPRSEAMVVAELDRIRKSKIETIRPATPIPAHEGGNDSETDRENAVRRLMEYRYLCYVPYDDMKLDALFCAHDEAAVGLLAAIKRLDHTPPNPGWPEDRYKFGYEGTSHSNLFGGGRGETHSAGSVDAYMYDSDPGNIDKVGHRRWCLNPRMSNVGFASFKGYSAMWSMDTSRKTAPRFEFIAYPGPGYFPNTHFGRGHAWSISLSESAYLPPPAKGMKVTITPAQVELSQNKITQAGKPLELDHEEVISDGIVGSSCVVFHPVGLKLDPGCGYLVEVAGLKSNKNKPATLRYYVEFFKPEEAKDRGE